MSKIEFKPGDVKDVKPKVAEVLKGQSGFPIQVAFKHTHKRGVVLPRSGHQGVIEKGVSVTLTLYTPEQVWDVCTDIAYLADFHAADEFGSLTTTDAPKPVKESATTEAKV